MTRQKVISASDAARLIPDGAVVTVSSSSALGCPDAMLAAIGDRFDAEGHPRNLTTAPSDRGGRHVGRQGGRPSREAGVSRARVGRLLSVGPVFRRAACNLEDDHRRRDTGLQCAFRHPVRHSSRGGGQTAGRADQSGHGHVRRSGPRGLRHERKSGGGADRRARRIRRRRLVVLSDHHSADSDHSRNDRR